MWLRAAAIIGLTCRTLQIKAKQKIRSINYKLLTSFCHTQLAVYTQNIQNLHSKNRFNVICTVCINRMQQIQQKSIFGACFQDQWDYNPSSNTIQHPHGTTMLKCKLHRLSSTTVLLLSKTWNRLPADENPANIGHWTIIPVMHILWFWVSLFYECSSNYLELTVC